MIVLLTATVYFNFCNTKYVKVPHSHAHMLLTGSGGVTLPWGEGEVSDGEQVTDVATEWVAQGLTMVVQPVTSQGGGGGGGGGGREGGGDLLLQLCKISLGGGAGV